jgi:hypothetical protein
MARKRKARPDGMLVLAKHLLEAREAIAGPGMLPALAELGEREPVLANYIGEAFAAMSGRLALSGAPTELVRGIHQECLLVALSAVEAQRQATYELWQETTFGTMLEELIKPEPPPPEPKPPAKKPRRKKGS